MPLIDSNPDPIPGPDVDGLTGVVGVGVDLVHVPSFAEQLARPGSRFPGVFTTGERADVASRGEGAQQDARWAARWAAREAVIKAWSSALHGMAPVLGDEALEQISVACDAWGRPRILLTGAVSRHLAGYRIDLSLSHDGDYAMAYVVLSAARR